MIDCARDIKELFDFEGFELADETGEEIEAIKDIVEAVKSAGGEDPRSNAATSLNLNYIKDKLEKIRLGPYYRRSLLRRRYRAAIRAHPLQDGSVYAVDKRWYDELLRYIGYKHYDIDDDDDDDDDDDYKNNDDDDDDCARHPFPLDNSAVATGYSCGSYREFGTSPSSPSSIEIVSWSVWEFVMDNFGGGPCYRRNRNVSCVLSVSEIRAHDPYKAVVPSYSYAGDVSVAKFLKFAISIATVDVGRGEWKCRIWGSDDGKHRDVKPLHDGCYVFKDGKPVVKKRGDQRPYDLETFEAREFDMPITGHVAIEYAKVDHVWGRNHVVVGEDFRDKIREGKVRTLDVRSWRGSWHRSKVIKVETEKFRVEYGYPKVVSWYNVGSNDVAPLGSYAPAAGGEEGRGEKNDKDSGNRRQQHHRSSSAASSQAAAQSSSLSVKSSSQSPYSTSAAGASSTSSSSSSRGGGGGAFDRSFPGFGVSGLANLGNTCYMNAAIQCVSHLPLLRSYVLSGRYERDVNVGNPLGTKGELTRSFADLMAKMYGCPKKPLEPRDFKRSLAKSKPQFSGNDQQDSQEFLTCLLDSLHEDVNKVKSKPVVPPMPDSWKVRSSLSDVAREAWRRFLLRNDSIISDIAMGQSHNKVTCPSCGGKSSSFDPFAMLSVPIPTSTEVTVRVTLYRRATPYNVNISSSSSSSRKSDYRGNAKGYKDGSVFPPSKRLVAEQYAVAVSRLSDFGDVKLRLQNLTSLPRSSLILCLVVEGDEVNRDLDGKCAGRLYDVVELADRDGVKEWEDGLEGGKGDIGEGTSRITRLVCFERTLNVRDVDFEFDEDREKEKLAEKGMSPGSTDAEIDEALNKVFFQRYEETFVALCSSSTECYEYDTSVTLMARRLSARRWPRTNADVGPSLIGMRFDMEDAKKTIRGQVTGVVVGSSDSSDEEDDPGSGRLNLVRVHFDRYGTKFDRDYSIKNFSHHKICPLYATKSKSKSSEGNSSLRVKVYQRRARMRGDDQVDSSSPPDTSLHLNFGIVQILHCMLEWSTARAGAHVLQQLSRFINDQGTLDDVNDCVNVSRRGHRRQRFRQRRVLAFFFFFVMHLNPRP